VRANVIVVKVSVDPLMTPTLVVKASERTNVPAEDASQNDTWEMVSVVVIEYPPTDDKAIDPALAAAKVTALRVVTALALAVPAAPGSPTCSFMNGLMAVMLTARK
jgi:hypothetical protein